MSVYQDMSDTHDMIEQDTAVEADAPPREESDVAKINDLAVQANELAFKARHPRLSRMPHFVGFDTFVARVRDATPAIIVSNGSRICLALKGAADICSIISARDKRAPSLWRERASFVSLGGELLGTLFPEKKISKEREEQYRKMNKVEYAFAKTKEALNPVDNVTETIGLTLMVNGAFMAKSGLMQSGHGLKEKSWEVLAGGMTALAGSFMTYMTDRERAWQISHAIFTLRTPAAAMQAHTAYKYGYPNAPEPVPPGDKMQWAKFGLNQIACVVGVLYGGVKKMPDGSIQHIGKNGVEYTAPRQSRKEVASNDWMAPKSIDALMPKPYITHATDPAPETSISQMAQMGKVQNSSEVTQMQGGAV